MPYGIFSRTAEGERQVGVAIGDWVIDLAALEKHGLLKLSDQDTYFNQPTLNKFIESGKANWSKVRKTLQSLLSVENLTLQENEALRQVFSEARQRDFTFTCSRTWLYRFLFF